MSAYYQTLLSLNFAIFALAAGGIGSIYQLVSGAGGIRVARLAVANRAAAIFIVVSLTTIAVCLLGAVLLTTTHDLIPQADANIDWILTSPGAGLFVGLLTLANLAIGVVALVRAASALSPSGAAALLTSRWELNRQIAVEDFEAIADLARKALIEGRHVEYGRVLDDLSSSLSRAGALDDRLVLETANAIEKQFVPLASEAVLSGRPIHAADVADLAGELAVSAPGKVGLLSFLRIQALVADMLFERRAATALAHVIGEIAGLGVLGLPDKEAIESPVFDDACRTIGAIGERIPAVFLDPSDPEVLMNPDSTGIDSPLGALVQAWTDLIDGAYPYGSTAPVVDLLIWRDGLMRSIEALVAAINHRFENDRLESPLVSLAGTLGHAGTRAAQDDHWQTAWIVALALGTLAEPADQRFYREYPRDLTSWLMEIGMRAEEDNAVIKHVGSLAEIAAEKVAENLGRYAETLGMDLYLAGALGPVSQEARLDFLKRLGAKLGTNFGLRF